MASHSRLRRSERAEKIDASQKPKQALEAADMLVKPLEGEQMKAAAATMMTQQQSQMWMDEPLMLQCTECGAEGEADTGKICSCGLCCPCCERLLCECWDTEMQQCAECGCDREAMDELFGEASYDSGGEWLCRQCQQCEPCCEKTGCGCDKQEPDQMNDAEYDSEESASSGEFLWPDKCLECDAIVLGGGLRSECRGSEESDSSAEEGDIQLRNT